MNDDGRFDELRTRWWKEILVVVIVAIVSGLGLWLTLGSRARCLVASFPLSCFFFTFLLAYRLGMHCISLLFFSSLIMSGWWRWLLLLLFSLVCFVHRVLPYCLCVCPQLSSRMNEWMNRSRLSAHALQQLAKPCSSFCVRNLHDNWENVPWKQENVGTFCCGQFVFL